MIYKDLVSYIKKKKYKDLLMSINTFLLLFLMKKKKIKIIFNNGNVLKPLRLIESVFQDSGLNTVTER